MWRQPRGLGLQRMATTLPPQKNLKNAIFLLRCFLQHQRNKSILLFKKIKKDRQGCISITDRFRLCCWQFRRISSRKSSTFKSGTERLKKNWNLDSYLSGGDIPEGEKWDRRTYCVRTPNWGFQNCYEKKKKAFKEIWEKMRSGQEFGNWMGSKYLKIQIEEKSTMKKKILQFDYLRESIIRTLLMKIEKSTVGQCCV